MSWVEANQRSTPPPPVENGEQALIGKKFIGHQSDEKGRQNGTMVVVPLMMPI